MQSADQTNIPDNNQASHFFLVKGVARGGKGKKSAIFSLLPSLRHKRVPSHTA